MVGPMSPPVENVIRVARRSEERGYDAIWWPDHLMGLHHALWTPEFTPLAPALGPHVYIDPVAAIAVVGVTTERVRLGTAVTEAVRRHPAMLANAWLSLDHITKGRVILGIGSGEEENNVPYGIDFSRPVARLEEALTIIRLLWESQGPVDFEGDFWRLRGAVVGLGPYTPGRFPEIWVGANGPRMLDIAGRHADGWLPTIVPPGEYAAKLGRVRAAARAAGRDPSRITAGMSHYAILDQDHEDCHRLMRHPIVTSIMLTLPSEAFEERGLDHPLGKGHRGMPNYVPTRYSREVALAAAEAVPDEMAHDLIFHGTPDEVVARVREYEAVGLQHFILFNITGLGDPSRARNSFRLADAVLDLLKRAPMSVTTR